MGCVEGEDGGESERDSVLPWTACHAAQNRTGSSRPRDAAALAGAEAFIADIPGELCGVGTGRLSQRFLCLYLPVAVEIRSLYDGHVEGRALGPGPGSTQTGKEDASSQWLLRGLDEGCGAQPWLMSSCSQRISYPGTSAPLTQQLLGWEWGGMSPLSISRP